MNQQKRVVVVAGIVTVMAAVTMATRQRGSNLTAMVMDGNRWCDDNAIARPAMEGVRQRQWMAQP